MANPITMAKASRSDRVLICSTFLNVEPMCGIIQHDPRSSDVSGHFGCDGWYGNARTSTVTARTKPVRVALLYVPEEMSGSGSAFMGIAIWSQAGQSDDFVRYVPVWR